MLFLTSPAIAFESTFTVRDEYSLSEVSLRLYGKARHWKKIARWNGIKPGYKIRKGQALVIKAEPELSDSAGKKKLLANRLERNQFKRSKRSDLIIFTVKDETCLSELAQGLFGTTRYWPKIARWNHMNPPYHIYRGQKLQILERPQYDQGASENKPSKIAADQPQLELESAKSSISSFPSVLSSPSPKPVEEKPRSDITTAEGLIPVEDDAPAPKATPAKIEDALKRVEAIESASGDTYESAFIGAKASFDAGDWSLAAKGFRKLRELKPESVPPWFMEIRSLLNLKLFEDAATAASQLCEKHPEFKALPWVKSLLRDSK